MALPHTFFGLESSLPSMVSVEFSAGQRVAAGLLLAASPAVLSSIIDGTSNTILLGQAPQSVWGDPHENVNGKHWALTGGFGLLLPASHRDRFAAGQLLPAFQLLPYVEASSATPGAGTTTTALKVQGAKVKGQATVPAGVSVWLTPQSIIAILISL
jgi:hypothetical protein